jgi:carbon monoxide dehydrogenase subunit G
MKIAGEATARGSVETVWGALHDAAILARAIPGCEQFEVPGPGLGQFIATTALPAIGGTYAGKLTIAEQQRPSLLKLTVSATGEQGTMTADVTLRLSDTADASVQVPGGSSPERANTVLVRYEANGTVTGSIAGVGTRLLASAAKRLADEFFAGLDQTVAVPEPAAVEPAPRALDRPRPRPEARTALIAGAAIGLAGVLIGVLAGRRGRRASGYGRD